MLITRGIIDERVEIHKIDTVIFDFRGSAVPLSVYDDVSF